MGNANDISQHVDNNNTNKYLKVLMIIQSIKYNKPLHAKLKQFHQFHKRATAKTAPIERKTHY